jgi:hypothetical protein
LLIVLISNNNTTSGTAAALTPANVISTVHKTTCKRSQNLSRVSTKAFNVGCLLSSR